MYIKPNADRMSPPGVAPLRAEDRKNQIVRAFVGDTVTIDTTIVSVYGRPANPHNSIIEVVLAENQFGDPIWCGRWTNGVREDDHRPGLVHIEIPRDITKALRRGSYMFSIRVTGLLGYVFNTQVYGYLLMEYMPTSEQHSIPYRDGTSENFPNGGAGKDESQVVDEEFLVDESGGKWHLGVTNVGSLTTTPVGHLPLPAEIAEAAREEARKANKKVVEKHATK